MIEKMPIGLQAAGARAVWWGPFPLRFLRLIGGLVILGMTLLTGYSGTRFDSLICTRDESPIAQCEFHNGRHRERDERFTLSSLHAVAALPTEAHARGRSEVRGQVVLFLGDHEIRMLSESPRIAQRHAEAIENFRQHSDVMRVKIATERELYGLFAMVLMGAAGITLLGSVIASRRRFRCAFDDARQQLIVQQEWPFGISLGDAERFDLKQPQDVDVDWGEVEDSNPTLRAPSKGGRLVVRFADGRQLPLSRHRFIGYRIHIEAAEALRALIGCPARSSIARETFIAANERARPQPSPFWTSLFGKIAAVWIGGCCGSLLGILVGVTLSLQTGLHKATDPVGGPWYFGGLSIGLFGGIAFAWSLTQHTDAR